VNEPNCNRAFYLPRLPREYYQGDAVVHWTLSISNRRRGWLNERFHAAFRELALHTAAREGLFCPTYCLMPDHLHLGSLLHPMQDDFWPKFWKLYAKAKHSDAGMIVRSLIRQQPSRGGSN